MLTVSRGNGAPVPVLPNRVIGIDVPAMKTSVDLIWRVAALDGQDRSDPIDLESVREWMSDDNIETQGILWNMLGKKKFLSRINPAISLVDINNFFLSYYRRCLLENPDGEWSDSRYSVGWSLTSWFKKLWSEDQRSKQCVTKIKNTLAELYRTGDDEVKVCIVNATLEHLFEVRAISRFFKDWYSDPVLKAAYEDAMLWTKRGGSTPL